MADTSSCFLGSLVFLAKTVERVFCEMRMTKHARIQHSQNLSEKIRMLAHTVSEHSRATHTWNLFMRTFEIFGVKTNDSAVDYLQFVVKYASSGDCYAKQVRWRGIAEGRKSPYSCFPVV